MASNICNDQVLAASFNMQEKPLHQYFMVMSLLFEFCEEQMSSFKVVANNVSGNQVSAGYIYAWIDPKKTKARFLEDQERFEVMANNITANQV